MVAVAKAGNKEQGDRHFIVDVMQSFVWTQYESREPNGISFEAATRFELARAEGSENGRIRCFEVKRQQMSSFIVSLAQSNLDQ